MRRAGFAYAVTQGFSPKMRISFGPALPVATGGDREYFDVWLRQYVAAPQALERLAAASPVGLGPMDVGYVGENEQSLSATLTVARYEVVLSEEVDPEALQRALGAVIAVGRLEVEHKGKAKVFDLATSLPKEPVAKSSEGRTIAEVVTRMGPNGSLRPDELVRQAMRQANLDGAVETVTRTDLFVEDGEAWRRPL